MPGLLPFPSAPGTLMENLTRLISCEKQLVAPSIRNFQLSVFQERLFSHFTSALCLILLGSRIALLAIGEELTLVSKRSLTNRNTSPVFRMLPLSYTLIISVPCFSFCGFQHRVFNLLIFTVLFKLFCTNLSSVMRLFAPYHLIEKDQEQKAMQICSF